MYIAKQLFFIMVLFFLLVIFFILYSLMFLIGKSRRTTNVNGIRVFVLSVHMGHMCTDVT